MDFLAGTGAGIFAGGPGSPAGGLEERGIRHISMIGGDFFAGASDGVYRSSDGRSWTRTGAEGKEVWDVGHVPGDDRTVYAGTQPAHIFASHDGGSSWYGDGIIPEGARCDYLVPAGHAAAERARADAGIRRGGSQPFPRWHRGRRRRQQRGRRPQLDRLAAGRKSRHSCHGGAPSQAWCHLRHHRLRSHRQQRAA